MKARHEINVFHSLENFLKIQENGLGAITYLLHVDTNVVRAWSGWLSSISCFIVYFYDWFYQSNWIL